MILDSEIPRIGSTSLNRTLAKAFAGVQDKLLRGEPLLVDAKGRASTELRKGGILDEMVGEWGPTWAPGILDASGKPVSTYEPIDWTAPAKREALMFSIDMPYQAVAINRKDIPPVTWKDEVRWWIQDRRYQLEEWLERPRKLDLGPLTIAWRQP
jgi:hypothetical protein